MSTTFQDFTGGRFLNRETAVMDDEMARAAEIAQAHAERDQYKALYEATLALLNNYGAQLVSLHVRIALMELERSGG